MDTFKRSMYLKSWVTGFRIDNGREDWKKRETYLMIFKGWVIGCSSWHNFYCIETWSLIVVCLWHLTYRKQNKNKIKYNQTLDLTIMNWASFNINSQNQHDEWWCNVWYQLTYIFNFLKYIADIMNEAE